MPDLKDKNSRLNPSQADFDDIVSQPDMRAPDSRGDQIAHNLKSAENGAPASGNFYERDGKDTARKAEAKEWSEAGKYDYSPDSKQKLQVGIKGWSRRKKTLVSGGLAGGLGTVLAIIFLLFPMKIPGLMQLVTDEAGQRVQQATEQRAKLIIARAILTKFGTHTGIVITGEGAFSTLVASMRTTNFEKKLAAKGLTIHPTSDGVRIRLDNELIGDGKNLRTDIEVLRALEGRPVTNKMINTIVKEEIPAWRLLKKAKFAKWLRIKYGVPRFGLANSDADNEEDAVREMDQERVKSVNARISSFFTGAITCVISGTCEATNTTGESSDSKVSTADANDTQVDVEQLGTRTEEEVAKSGLTGLQETTTKKLVGAFAAKSIPYIGWIDIVATLDHHMNKALSDDYIGKVSAYYKGASYAAIYADWSGYASQISLGAMIPAYVGSLSEELDDAETAQMFQVSEGNPDKGTPVETFVNSSEPSEIHKFYKSFIESSVGMQYQLIGHPIANAYYETVGGGGILGWAGKLLASALSPLTEGVTKVVGIITPDSLKKAALDAVVAMGPFLLETLGLTIDAFEKGGKLMNNIFSGGIVSFNDYAKEFIGRKLTMEQTYEINQSIAAERNAYRKEKGLAYMLFNKEDSRSVINKLAMSIPSDPSTGVTALARAITSTPSKLFSLTLPKTSATSLSTYESILKVQPYGATTADLEKPLSDQFIKGEECLEVAEGEFKDCTLDTITAESLTCGLDDTGCFEDDDEMSSVSGEFDMRIATYNIRIAGQAGSDDRGHAAPEIRFPLAAKIIRSNDFDVVGLQEIEPQTFRALNDTFRDLNGGESEYSSHPKSLSESPNLSYLLPIFWKKDSFTEVKAGYYDHSGRLCKGVELCVKGSWVRLTNGGGSDFYVMNTHLVNRNSDNGPGSSDAGGAQKREASAKSIIDTIASFEKGIPVFLTGDMNSSWNITHDDPFLKGDRSRIPYCIFTKEGVLANAVDIVEGKKGSCPVKNRPYEIDHIYVSPGVDVKKVRQIRNSDTIKASDHDPVYADIKGKEGSSSGDMTWPVSKEDWPKSTMPVAECGLLYSDGTIHTGMDISVPTGTPVRAATDGRVVEVGGSYGSIRIVTKMKTNSGKQIYLNYQHLSEIHVGTNIGDSIVGKGQVIGKSGSVGTGSPHLHFGVWSTDRFLSGHSSPSSSSGRATLSNMLHPMTYMPDDGRNINECKKPYAVP